MRENPYQWHFDRPTWRVQRPAFSGQVHASIREGKVAKVVGGRGMGKSVLLRQIADELDAKETRVVLIRRPPDEATLSACVRDLARLLGTPPPTEPSLDALIDAVLAEGVRRVVLLFDEVDQYVLRDQDGSFARNWFNRVESLRKDLGERGAVVVAGGLGLLHLSHALGSGLLSRADSHLATPFDLDELHALATPFDEEGAALTEEVLATLLALTGGNPALATYGLQRLWGYTGDAVGALRRVFGAFSAEHPDFLHAVTDAVSRRGMLHAPGRALAAIRAGTGTVSQQQLQAACDGEQPRVDVVQALQLLMAAGLVRASGDLRSDPVLVHPVASILNLLDAPASSPDPVERLLTDVAAVLGHMHRFGRDFHSKDNMLEEQVFSSLLAVGLASRGWNDTRRESVQAAGYPDLIVGQGGLSGHFVVETKIWSRANFTEIQQQVDDYRVADTVHGVAVMFGARRGVDGWASEYERQCLPKGAFVAMPTPPNVVGHWRVEQAGPGNSPRRTDHFLVNIPKRR